MIGEGGGQASVELSEHKMSTEEILTVDDRALLEDEVSIVDGTPESAHAGAAARQHAQGRGL